MTFEKRAELNKTVSAMNFYAYRIMIRTIEENHILKCRQLFHQYITDMYAKIQSERLRYIRFNQGKTRLQQTQKLLPNKKKHNLQLKCDQKSTYICVTQLTAT